MHAFYLHGFTSSPRSTKARFFEDRFAEIGVRLHVPDFNRPDFSTLTVSRMLTQLEAAARALPVEPLLLVGSSLGGFVAWHAASRWQRRGPAAPLVRGLVLLAPALEFGANGARELGDVRLAEWARTGWTTVHHIAYGGERRVHYALYDDALQYDSWAAPVSAPALVFMGARDSVVDPEMVQRFADAHAGISLTMLDDEHQLLGHLDDIWRRTVPFLASLGGDGPRPA
ncbi:MAG: YqiA/YcfP family alpha/beta fold hydrolase [Vicinamibacterales bacterium]